MSKFRSIKNSFLGGQISPTALGRTDLPQYPHACELLFNMIPMLGGGAYRRPGTLSMDTSDIVNGIPRLFEFIASKNEAYAIGFYPNPGVGCFGKAYRATSNISSGLSSSIVSGTPPWQYTKASDQVASGNPDDEIFQVQYAQSVDKMYMTHPKRKPQILSRGALDSFSIADFDAGLSGVALVNAYPFLNQNLTAITLAGSATTGSITLTASAALFAPGHVGAIFVIDSGAGNVGAVKVTGYTDSTHVSATVLVTLGGTTAKAAWWESAWSDFRGWPRSVCIFQQRLCYASTFHQPDTMWFSGSQNYPVMSKLANTYVDGGGTSHTVIYADDSSEGNGYSTGPTGSQPFRITLSQSQLDAILWLSPDKELLVGTLSQEYLVTQSSGATSSFDVSSAVAVIQSKYGSDWLSPVRIGYELIMPMGTQDEVRAYQYNYIDASFFAEPVQMLFDQYPGPELSGYTPGRRKFRQSAWDVSRQTLWCVDTAGNLFGLTRDRKQQITNWHTHQMGGYDPTQGQQALLSGLNTTADPGYATCLGSVLSMAIVPNPISGINDLWLAVKRKVNGNVSVSIERMIGKNTVRASAYSNVYPGPTATEPFMIDCAVCMSDNGDGTLTYGGFANLAGAASLTGTYYSPTFGMFKVTSGAVNASGNVAINRPVSPDYGTTPGNWLTLGYPFTPIIQPARIDAGSVIGTSQGAVKKINRCIVRLFKTIGVKIGSPPKSEDQNPLEAVNFYDPNAPMGKSPEIFTGDKIVTVPSTYERDGYIYLRQDDPLPFTVISIVSEGVEFD